MSTYLRVAGLLLLLTVTMTLTAMAQQPVGSIDGTVTDQNGAVIVGATITITEKATARTITATTNESGYFVVRALIPGQYTVKIEQKGFGTATLNNVVVLVGQVANTSKSLSAGGTEAVIDVSASTDIQVDTTRNSVDGVVRAREIDQLPLNGRNFLDLARLEPGVVVRDGGAVDPTKTNSFRAVGVNGRSGRATRVTIDGIDVTDETVGTTTSNISDDAVSEFQLSRSSLDMSTSLTSSGAINVVTKSGSNDVHGSFFFFDRNQSMSGKQTISQTGPNGPFHRKQYGFRAGGAIVKDKLFWFANWEKFDQANNVVTDPASVTFFPQMAGNVSIPVYIRNDTGRLDWNVNNNIRAFYSFKNSADNSGAGSIQSPFQNVDWTNTHTVGVDVTQSKLTHSFRFGYVNFNNHIDSTEYSQFPFPRAADGTPIQLNVGQFAQGPNSLAPQQTFQDNDQFKYDGSYTRGDHTFRFGGDISRIVLGGFANFAGPVTVNGNFSTQPKTLANPLGGTREQVIDAGLDPTNPLNYPLTSFGIGPPNGFFTIPAAHGFAHGGNYNTRLAWYVGDSWRVRRNLTINIGTRWEHDSGYYPNEAKDGVRRPAILGQVDPDAAFAPKFPKNLFGPNIGFAYSPFEGGKTVIRGGFSMDYEMNIYNNTIFSESALIPPGIGPDTYSQASVTGPDGTPINIDGNHPTGVYTDLVNKPIKDVIGTITALNKALQTAYANYKFDPSKGPSAFEILKGNVNGGIFPGVYNIPYSLQFNIGVQREIKPGTVLTVDYVRVRGVGLPFLLSDFENRLDASTLNAAVAQTTVNTFLAGQGVATVDAYIAKQLAANKVPLINDFKLATDAVFTGKTSSLLRARIFAGGYSTFQAIQAKLDGRLTNKLWLFKSISYRVAYSLARSESTCGNSGQEFGATVCDNHNVQNPDYFGRNGFSFTHSSTSGLTFDTPGGFRFSSIVSVSTLAPGSFTIPALNGVTSANALFTTDINGDGGRGTTPATDLLPGTKQGQFGREIKSTADINALISAFNFTQAGKLTPAGQALVTAGIFTAAQMAQLKGVSPIIPLVPGTNPNPFASNPFNIDLRITRPIKIENAKIVKNLEIEPYFDAFNLFNRRGHNGYSGLGAGYGSLNFDYANATSSSQNLAALRATRGFAFGPRLLQFGFRVSF